MAWQVAGYERDADKPFDQGSFGTVWHARRTCDGSRVALKLVRRTGADAAERIDAERRGALLQRAFHDAHGLVPAVYDIGYDQDDDLFIAMELIEGGALADLIGRGALDATTAATHAAAICAFLEKAHSFSTTIEGDHYDRLVHADLKPGHIFARPSGEVIVLDFGIAKAMDKATPLTTNNWGTSAYMSPERLIDGRVDEQVDFWSLGIMLYEMLAGHRPYRAYHAPSLKSQLERAIRGNAPREPLPASVPPGLIAIVSKLLAYQPERRYPNATAIRADLHAFLAHGHPLALAEYDTPATTRVTDALPVPPGDATMPVASTDPLPLALPPLPPLPGYVPPTTPLHAATPPLPAAPATPLPPAVPVPPAARAARPRKRSRLYRFLRVAAVLWALWALTSEATAWMQAERFRHAVSDIDGPALSAAEASYDRIASASPLKLGLRMRADGPLESHLLALADRVIEDYRHDQPSLLLADWKQAEQAMRWALRVDPQSRAARARLYTCEAHIVRITTKPGKTAAAQAAYRRAIDRFRAAARLDADSYDAYLGISRVAIYGLVPADVDLASSSVREAEKRGYTPGRRERAQLGDGYMRRADTLRRDARELSGDERTRTLQKARSDYQGCIETFEPIVGFGLAARNIEVCKQQRASLDEELTPEMVEHEMDNF
ncbi:MAG TPA: serine/threonine-protein kinase [Luteitalea sp.]|nr:serine/threonine-protein kinase [Luteitalea sp.]